MRCDIYDPNGFISEELSSDPWELAEGDHQLGSFGGVLGGIPCPCPNCHGGIWTAGDEVIESSTDKRGQGLTAHASREYENQRYCQR
jgi:hypothetical protein